jgi:hypothetical protein
MVMSRTPLALVWLLTTVAGMAAGTAVQPSPEVEIAGRLRDYLDRYEPLLGALVADERFEQTFKRQGYRRRRVLVSEVGFLRLPGDLEWVGHRSVRQVDRQPVRVDAISLAEVLQKSGEDLRVQARLLFHQSAPFNLGHGPSVPTGISKAAPTTATTGGSRRAPAWCRRHRHEPTPARRKTSHGQAGVLTSTGAG